MLDSGLARLYHGRMDIISNTRYLELAEANRSLQEFGELLVQRFKEWMLVDGGRDIDAQLRTSGGFMSVKPNINSAFVEDKDDYIVYVVMANDRGPSDTTPYRVPRSVIFSRTEAEEEYREYMRLRARFEPKR